MFRIINLFVLGVTILTAFALYRVKYEVRAEAHHVAELRNELEAHMDAIALLQAEWSHLNEPARVQELAQRHLNLKPAEAHQIVSLRDLPRRARDPYMGHARVGNGQLATGSVR